MTHIAGALERFALAGTSPLVVGGTHGKTTTSALAAWLLAADALLRAESVARFLTKLGEPTEPPRLSPARGPPYFKSRALRRKLGELDGQARQLEMFGDTSVVDTASQMGLVGSRRLMDELKPHAGTWSCAH